MNIAPLLRGELRVKEPMSRHVSWRAGGPADRFYHPADLADLAEFLRRLPADEPILWLGLGSNLLVRDGGFRGTVVALHGVMDHISDLGAGRLRVESGVHCARLAKYCAQNNLAGAAFFVGIPGTVGGALAMNAGAFKGETWHQVESVEILHRDGRIETLPASAFQISYRTVVSPAPNLCFVAANLRFSPNDKALGQAEIRDMLAERKSKQPVGQPSCGSVFRNPPNDYAARLIEAAGLKGYRIGDAIVSDKHANFILNADAARANDIEALLKHVQATVKQRFGIELEPEVRIVGELGSKA